MLRKLAIFREEINTGRRRHAKDFRLASAVRNYWAWASRGTDNALDDEEPWINFTAKRYLERLLSRTSRIFEFGMGGSTLYFARRAAEVISVEHDEDWFRRVSRKVEAAGLRNWKGMVVAPERPGEGGSDGAGDYSSTHPALEGCTLRAYASSIDAFPSGYFDIVLIDGRARVGCFAHAVRKIADTGSIILDNSERDEYSKAFTIAETFGLKAINLFGPGPYTLGFWRTSFFVKRQEASA